MTYTIPNPRTWVDGETPDAVIMNDQIKAFMALALDPPQASIYNTSALSVPNNSWTNVTFDSDLYDNDGMHDTASNTGRLVFKTPGLYVVSVGVYFAASGTGGRAVNLTKNGAGTRAASNVVFSDAGIGATATAETIVQVAVQRRFSADDYIELWLWQNSGGALNAQAGTNKTFLSAVWVGR